MQWGHWAHRARVLICRDISILVFGQKNPVSVPDGMRLFWGGGMGLDAEFEFAGRLAGDLFEDAAEIAGG